MASNKIINLDIEHSTKSSYLIEANKKNIRNESSAVILLGLLYLVFFSTFMQTHYLYSYIIISALYIVTGIPGCMCLRTNNSDFQTLYKVLIIVLMLIKIICLGFSIFLIVVLILNARYCSKSQSETCILGAALWMIVMVLSMAGLIIFSATLSFFYVMLKHLNNYQEDIRLLGYIYFN